MLNSCKSFWENYILLYLINPLRSLNVRAFLLDLIFSFFITKFSYKFMLENIILPKKNKVKSMLDIGIGTGLALKSIAPYLGGIEILGIDIHESYILKAQSNLKAYENITIRKEDFYQMEKKLIIIRFLLLC